MCSPNHRQVQLTALDRFFGNAWRAEAPCRSHWYPRLTLHALGNFAHEARRPGNVGFSDGETNADAQQIQATIFEATCQFDSLGQRLFVPAVVFDNP